MIADQTNRRILVVDDNASIHADFVKILGSDAKAEALAKFEAELFGGTEGKSKQHASRYQIDSAQQGEAALEMVKQAVVAGRPYALAFVDMRMPPGWDGMKTITKIWEVAPDTQIVICTAYSDYSWQDIVSNLGRSDRYLILKKPFEAVEVRQLALTLSTKWNLARQAKLREDQLEQLVEDRTKELGAQKDELEQQIIERVKAEKALQLTQFSVDRAADAVFWIAEDGSFHYANEAACRSLGYARPELEQNKTIFDICPGMEKDAWAEQWQSLRAEGMRTSEAYHRRHDETEFPVEVTYNYLHYDGTEYQCAFARDITERKRSEQALQDLVAGTAALVGEEFFPALVWHLTRALEVRSAIVTQMPPDRPGRLRVISIWGTDAVKPGTDYEFKGLPCEHVLRTGAYGCARQLREHFPDQPLYEKLKAESYMGVVLTGSTGQAVGHLCVIDDKAMLDPRRTRSIMTIFAARAASELEREQIEQALSQSEERYALAAQGANDGLWDWNLKTGEIYFSPRWKAMVGFSEGEVDNSPSFWLDRVHPDDLPQLKRDLDAHLSGQMDHFENEHRLRCKDGEYRWMLNRGLAVRAFDVAYRIAGSQTDITSRKAVEDQLRHDANHDRLTGLPNRAMFMTRLSHCIERARRNAKYEFAVLFLDLDRFKVINDSLGHVAGDKLLTEMTERLTRCLREGDAVARNDQTVARLGGDEFTILLEDITATADAVRVAERIRKAVAQPMRLGDQEVTVGVSIGIATSRTPYTRPEEILRDADTAMYYAKGEGSVGYRIFDKNMHARAMRRLQLENELRHALDNRELRPCYQPIVNLKTGQIIGLEALLRWAHPSRGIILPSSFIPVAEETGLINPIGREVLRMACEDLVVLQEQIGPEYPIWVSVNLSRKQLVDASFAEDVVKTVDQTGLSAGSLMLEITESVMMSSEADHRVLERIKDSGVKLLMDDFGTGYSSLCYLPSFPVDGIKIGPPFVTNLGTLLDYSAILKAITTMAHDMGLSVIAEGVETEEQLANIKAFDCDCCQGHFFAKAMEMDHVRELIVSEKRFEVV